LYELSARRESEERYIADSRLAIVSPCNGVVWSSSLAPGSDVSPGATALEIVDPDALCIEATFSQADAERVLPGRLASARLLGSSRVLTGRVVRVADPGTIDQGTVNVTAGSQVLPGTFRAVVELSEQPRDGNVENRFHIGASALAWVAR
jgi:multidrug resistance efflux pump